jgi:hypothetical protein
MGHHSHRIADLCLTSENEVLKSEKTTASHRKLPGVARTQTHRPPVKPGVPRSEQQVVSPTASCTNSVGSTSSCW